MCRFTDKVTVLVSKGVNITISLSAEGEGTTIVSRPPLQPRGEHHFGTQPMYNVHINVLVRIHMYWLLISMVRLTLALYLCDSGPRPPLLLHLALSAAIHSNEQGPSTAGPLLGHTGLLGSQAEEDGDKESHTRCERCRKGMYMYMYVYS